MKKFYFLNGKIVSSDKAQIPLRSLVVMRGYGVFDSLRSYNGKLFHFTDHYKRFKRSATLFGLSLRYSQAEVEKILNQLFKKNKCIDAHIRLMLLGGETTDALTSADPIFAIMIEGVYTLPKKYYTHGVKVITCEHQREWSQAKSINYLSAIRIQKQRQRAGALEIVYHHQGNILEASTSNFWMVKDGVLITAKDNVLHGITRAMVKRFAKELGLRVIEREVKFSELATADEAFLSATYKRAVPVIKVDKQIIGNGKVGPVTKQLMRVIDEYIESY
jgi:branched-chain amino acid aminotransferase